MRSHRTMALSQTEMKEEESFGKSEVSNDRNDSPAVKSSTGGSKTNSDAEPEEVERTRQRNAAYSRRSYYRKRARFDNLRDEVMLLQEQNYNLNKEEKRLTQLLNKAQETVALTTVPGMLPQHPMNSTHAALSNAMSLPVGNAPNLPPPSIQGQLLLMHLQQQQQQQLALQQQLSMLPIIAPMNQMHGLSGLNPFVLGGNVMLQNAKTPAPTPREDSESSRKRERNESE